MNVFFERKTEEAQLAMTCACGPCHPTATAYRDDPYYKRHDPRLAEGPCCCGRFFAIGHDEETARTRAEAIAGRNAGRTLAAYDLKVQNVTLPWGATVVAISASPRE